MKFCLCRLNCRECSFADGSIVESVKYNLILNKINLVVLEIDATKTLFCHFLIVTYNCTNILYINTLVLRYICMYIYSIPVVQMESNQTIVCMTCNIMTFPVKTYRLQSIHEFLQDNVTDKSIYVYMKVLF